MDSFVQVDLLKLSEIALGKTVRVNITLPHRVLNVVDGAAIQGQRVSLWIPRTSGA